MDTLVSIIIVNYNGKVHLDDCLDSIKKIEGYSNSEVLVIDNNSSDGSVDFVKRNYPDVKLIELKENLGFATSNNLGAKEAKGDFYIFLNNDTIVTKTWLDELVKSLKENNKEVAMAQSLLLRPSGGIDSSGDFIDKYGRAYSSKQTSPSNGREILGARAASMIVRKEVFWKLDGFEDDFFASFEDVHLGWKAWIAGYKVILASNSIVYHVGGQTVQKLKSTINFHSMKNQVSIILLDFEFPVSIKNLLALFPLYLSSVKISNEQRIQKENKENVMETTQEVYSNPMLLKDVIKTLFWLCRNSLILYKKYKRINRTRLCSTNYLRKIGLITDYRNQN